MRQFVAFSLLTCWANAACLAQSAPSTSSTPKPRLGQYLLTAEEEAAASEETLFPQLHAIRQVDAHHAHSGQAAVRLAAHKQPAMISSTLLPVQPGQFTLTVYANTATPIAKRSWPGYVGQALLGSAAITTIGTRSNMSGENLRSPGQRVFPIVGLGFALALPQLLPKHKPAKIGAYIQCRLYDENKQYLGDQQTLVTPTGNSWEPYQVIADVSAKGYIQVVLGNATSTPVWFDNVQATLMRQIAKPVKLFPSLQTGPKQSKQAKTNRLEGSSCTEYTDTYYNIYTGEQLWQDVYTICGSSGSGGGDSGGSTGGGGGGGSTSPGTGGSGPGPQAVVVPQECNGLQQALSTQAADDAEVPGYVTKDGNTILFSTLNSTTTSFNVSFPLYNGDNQLVTTGPYQDNGVWKIDMNDYSNGTHTYQTYEIAYGFHTHPIGKAPDGSKYDSTHPSQEDKNNAAKYAGMPQHIVTRFDEITYDSNGVTSVQANHCR